MGFEGLLGNERLRETLAASLNKGHISHFYLISGPEGSGKHTLAKLLAAAILCGDSRGPCMHCGVCRRVMADSHPDVITVADPEHKTVPVKLVREYREDAFIRPNESDYKIYLFSQDLGLEGQNALLKILEEPPAYGVFIILTTNPEKLLELVDKSKLHPDTTVYMDYGSEELSNHPVQKEALMDMSRLLMEKNVNLAFRIIPGGNHSEASWEKQIPIFMDCLGL